MRPANPFWWLALHRASITYGMIGKMYRLKCVVILFAKFEISTAVHNFHHQSTSPRIFLVQCQPLLRWLNYPRFWVVTLKPCNCPWEPGSAARVQDCGVAYAAPPWPPRPAPLVLAWTARYPPNTLQATTSCGQAVVIRPQAVVIRPVSVATRWNPERHLENSESAIAWGWLRWEFCQPQGKHPVVSSASCVTTHPPPLQRCFCPWAATIRSSFPRPKRKKTLRTQINIVWFWPTKLSTQNYKSCQSVPTRNLKTRRSTYPNLDKPVAGLNWNHPCSFFIFAFFEMGTNQKTGSWLGTAERRNLSFPILDFPIPSYSIHPTVYLHLSMLWSTFSINVSTCLSIRLSFSICLSIFFANTTIAGFWISFGLSWGAWIRHPQPYETKNHWGKQIDGQSINIIACFDLSVWFVTLRQRHWMRKKT